MSAKILLPLAIAAGSAAAFTSKKRRRRPRPSATISPFVDSACTQLQTEDKLKEWYEKMGKGAFAAAFAANPITASTPGAEANTAVHGYIDAIMATAGSDCRPWHTEPARQQLYKALWCIVMTELVMLVKVDEELEAVIALCANPFFQPSNDAADATLQRELTEAIQGKWAGLPAPDESGMFGTDAYTIAYWSYAPPEGSGSLVVAGVHENGDSLLTDVLDRDAWPAQTVVAARMIAEQKWG